MKSESRYGRSTRRTFLAQAGGVTLAICLPRFAFGLNSDVLDDPSAIVLEDERLRASFDGVSGALIGLTWKPAKWVIQRRPEFGISFRMHAPLPDRRDNFILGQKQRARKIEKLAENQIRIEWDNLVSEHGGSLPLRFAAVVTLESGSLKFASTLINDSQFTIESVEYPYIADLHAPKDGDPLRRQQVWYENLQSQELHPGFNNAIWGYWGFLSPMQDGDSSSSLFSLVQSKSDGLYVEVHDPNPQHFVRYTFEQKPGVLESAFNKTPEADAISGIPVHLEFRTTHFVFATPNSTTKLSPIVLTPYSGDWRDAVDLYKKWRNTWFHPRVTPEWAMDVHSWMEIQINSPEDDLRFRYTDLVKYGEECARSGIGAIQLVGWNYGGQDRGNPSLETDPRLGTWQDLRDAIARIQAMGVKVILFGKFVWADKSTDWYKRELHKYAAKDPYGEPYENPGYGYTTPTQLAGINSRRFAIMCFQCEEYRKIAAREFAKVVALGADGFLFDEVCHHGGVKYCFATDHGHPVPAYIFGGDVAMAEALHAEARQKPDFLFAGEAPEDLLLQHYPFSYFRIDSSSVPIGRYIDSRAPLMVSATGFDDREMLNRILMYRYVISYEPYNFKGHLSDFPLTLEYGKKIDALRRRYREWLWDAEYRDRLGATVMAGDRPYEFYSVFRNSRGKRAVVLVNDNMIQTLEVKVQLPNDAKLVVVTPEEPEPKPAGDVTRIGPRSATVLLEQ